MRIPGSTLQHTYRLVLSDDGHGPAGTIQFEASCADTALFHAQRQCHGREAELFEDERSLGRITCMQEGGYWLLSPSRSARGPG
jgi:hypothetical protein